MAKLTLNDVTSGFLATTLVNANNTKIEVALENTLSRDGTGPNQMEAALDMNGNMILNQANPITVSGFNWEGPWITGTSYQIGDVVENLNSSYIAIVDHVAGASFAADLAASKWQIVASSAALPTQSGHAGELLTTDGSNASWTNTVTTQLALKAPLAGPVFTGTPTAPTAAVDTNTTQLATTAFVLGQAADATPIVEAATGVVGVSTQFAREDHVHPLRQLPLTTVNTTSGTGVLISNAIPSWARRINLTLSGVSTNGTAGMVLQLGTVSGFAVSGYVSESSIVAAATVSTASLTTGFFIRTNAAAASVGGIITLSLLDPVNNKWACSGLVRSEVNSLILTAGDVTLSGTLTQIQIASSNTFDAGAIGISWE